MAQLSECWKPPTLGSAATIEDLLLWGESCHWVDAKSQEVIRNQEDKATSFLLP